MQSKPKIFVAENVKGMMTLGKGEVFKQIVQDFARIQTFPDWYEFSKGTSKRNENAKIDLIYKQIGNAVPVRLALAVAEPIAAFVKTQLEKKEKTYIVIQNISEKKRRIRD